MQNDQGNENVEHRFVKLRRGASLIEGNRCSRTLEAGIYLASGSYDITEGLGITDGQLGQHPTVQLKSSLTQPVNKPAVVDSVTTDSGGILALKATTLCVHGDNPAGVRVLDAIREILDAG